MPIKNGAQLITYPDSLGRNLPELHYKLKKYLHDAIGGIHLCPSILKVGHDYYIGRSYSRRNHQVVH